MKKYFKNYCTNGRCCGRIQVSVDYVVLLIKTLQIKMQIKKLNKFKNFLKNYLQNQKNDV